VTFCPVPDFMAALSNGGQTGTVTALSTAAQPLSTSRPSPHEQPVGSTDSAVRRHCTRSRPCHENNDLVPVLTLSPRTRTLDRLLYPR
jgi:hypothetical protein